MCLHGDHVGEDSKEGAGQVKKAIRWPAAVRKVKRGEYIMSANVGGEGVAVGVRCSVYGRWLFSVIFSSGDAIMNLYGYAHTMASAKRCAHRDMMFLLKRAGVKGVF